MAKKRKKVTRRVSKKRVSRPRKVSSTPITIKLPKKHITQPLIQERHKHGIFVCNMILFTIVLIIHLIRAFNKWPLVFNNTVIPIWFSYFVAVLLLVVIYSNYKAFKKD